MRHVVVLFWALILGQIVAYLGAALNHGLYNFPQAVMGSILIAIVTILVGEVSQPSKKEVKNS
ncbi:YjzD family protein [Vagococcus intermedius]|uniref:YjzD family protein n=1 Tax=Vagococcus intermedius TaxID=2991418 RepID=A0AAF0CW89_9ENTE|nr:YjzD family protein [Vagococcus intermedius]WEG74163.1 YjzD family protein [Vagococcus intermedius]WEG76243.1 YjzD family protein [Vagococcus intermedius]